MKLNKRDALAFFSRPDPRRTGILIYGPDAMRVALKRQDLIANLIGPVGEAEMRLTRLAGSDLRRDPSAATDAMKAVGFFAGQRAVLVEDAGDGVSEPLSRALEDWVEGDAMLVVTATQLAAKSKLRKAFEGHGNALAAAIYDDPPGRDEIEAELKRAGIGAIDRAAMSDLEGLARALDPGDFRQTLEKLALYKHGDASPLTSTEVANLAPGTIEAEVDDILNAVASGQTGRIGPLIRRLEGQGIAPVGLMIAATRHFRALHMAATDPKGPGAGLMRMRPPVFGPRRDAMERQARSWGTLRLEAALKVLLDTDLALRSAGQVAPQMALAERSFVRLSMMAERRKG